MKDDDQRRGWPIKFSTLRPPTTLSTPISVIAVAAFFVCTIIAMLALGWLLADLVSGDQRRASEAARTALPILAGAIGLPLIVWRPLILDRQTRISEEKTQIDRETHYTSIFSRGIDQLGQTREIKRTVQSSKGPIDTTTTVPNIEVRLGGIHSLSRLAEESLRDREKIDNVLRSYIRENSWSDRLGEVTKKPDWKRNPAWNWVYDLDIDPTDAEAREARDKWLLDTNEQIRQLEEWAVEVPETRVDVNESVDVLALRSTEDRSAPKPTFYECLFVGRHFNKSLLSLMNFRRCTFLRCTFDANLQSRFSIDDSNLQNASFTCNDADIKIQRSRLLNTSFRANLNSKIDLRWCDSYSTRIIDPPSFINLSDSIIYRLTMSGRSLDPAGPRPTTIDFSDSVLVSSSLRRLTLSTETNLGFAGSPELELHNVDLGAVKYFDEKTLNAAKADGKTIHPALIDRPPSWTMFGTKDDSDDIPF
jgi:uncharacterized protein YjbI with pentapeptide repeats